MEDNKNMFDYVKPKNSETPAPSYFKDLAEKVIDSQKTKEIPLYKRTSMWISAAAACIAILLTIQLTSNNKTNNTLRSLNNFSSEEIERYVADNIDDFDTELISEFIPSSSISPLEFTNRMEIKQQGVDETIPGDFDNISSQEILDYFDSQNEDFEDLEDLLF